MAKQFKNLTLQEKLVMFFEANNYKQIECKTNRAIAMKQDNKSMVYFILKNGFMRKSLTGKITDSFSCKVDSERFKHFCDYKEKEK